MIRRWDGVVRGLSSGYVWVNRNKRSVILNLKSPKAREVVRRLVEGADVLVENYAPGVAERLGLGYGEVREWNPRLVYCSISGYGRDGPYREMKAYDLLVQAEAGAMAVTGYPDLPAKVGFPVADLAAGLYGALGIVFALLDRERTGKGQFLEVSMFESLLSWLGYFPYHYWDAGEEPGRVGMRHHYIVPYGPFQAGDGQWVCFAVASDGDWKRFCERVIERPELVGHPDFGSVEGRRRHREALEALLEEIFRTRPAAEWEQRLQAAALPWGRMRSIGEVLTHPQVVARGMVQEVDSPVGRIKSIACPLRMERGRAREGRIPSLGEDTVPVLQELGFKADEIDRLAQDGVIANV